MASRVVRAMVIRLQTTAYKNVHLCEASNECYLTQKYFVLEMLVDGLLLRYGTTCTTCLDVISVLKVSKNNQSSAL